MKTVFNSEILQMARQSRGLSQSALAREVRLSQGLLSRYETGTDEQPTEELVVRLAECLKYPVSLFYQTDRMYGLPMSVHPAYRRKASVPQKKLAQLEAELNLRLLQKRRLLAAVDLEEELPIEERKVGKHGTPEEIAAFVRQIWRVPSGPIRNLTEYAERAGCLVIETDFSNLGIDGVTMRTSNLPPCIFISKDIPADRQRFTLAHELGHIFMHPIPNDQMEDEANSFAAALLMPAKDIMMDFTGRITLDRLCQLKPVWRASIASLLYRAKSLNKVTQHQYLYLWKRLSASGWRMKEPAEFDFPKEHPSIFPEIIRLHKEDLGYSPADISKIIHLSEEEFLSLYDVLDAETPKSFLSLVKK